MKGLTMKGVTPDIWGTHAVAEHCPKVMSRRNESALRVHSYRCGGYYVLTRTIACEADKLNDQEKARLTSWLFEQRQTGNKCPEITAEIISDIKQREKMSVSDRADAILLYTKSKIPEFDNIMVYDNLLNMRTLGMGEDQIYQFISRENIVYFELLICSECADKHDLTSLMGYLEQKKWIRYLKTKRPNELYVYYLTSEGYTRLTRISKTRDNFIFKTNRKQKINYADKDKTVKVFISYSWDNEEHKQWVANLAERLRSDGIEAILDQWEIALGDPVTHFMEEKIEESNYVLIICTPGYREKSKQRQGGVGYEDHVMTAEIYDKKNHRKYIPVIANDSSKESLPPFLNGKLFVSLSDGNYENGYLELKSTLLGKRPTPPPIRRRSLNG